MKINIKLSITACVLCVLTACGNNTTSVSDLSTATSKTSVTSGTTSENTVLSVDAHRPPANIAAQESPMKQRDLNNAPVASNISLGAPSSSLAATAQKSNETAANDQMGKPLQIGFGRYVTQTATPAATQQILHWKMTATGGQVAAINFNSTGAKGMRIGLLVTQLPETATLRFYAKGAATAFEVSGSEILDVLAKNLAAGDKTDEGRTYWSPVIKANNSTFEIEIPINVDINTVQVSVPIISHLFMSINEAQIISAQSTYDSTNLARTGNTSTLACQVDVNCSSALPSASDAVAWLVFNQSGGYANICSGTLLNDNLNSAAPYILTANHCISTQTFASTLYTEFKYRSLTCNNAATGEYFPTATTGAALLYTAYGTDSTLLRLYGTPSTSVLFAGWDATTAPTTSTTGIHSVHHPKGDQQRLSRGSITGYATRSATNPNLFSGSNIANGTILNVTLTTGLTEGGSSGSALFKGTEANPIVIGQLYGGSTPGNAAGGYAPACTTANPLVAMPPNNVYGRFDVAFNKGMSDYLVKGVKGVNRFYNNQSGTHFYTISAYEKDYLQTDFPTVFNYEGAPFKASTVTAAGLSPVHRFYNLNLGVYFYTISESERAFVAANLPQMRYEGIAWYANNTNVAGTVPLYRFYNRDKGVHFYTVSAAERASVIANLPQMNNEGIAYYVLP